MMEIVPDLKFKAKSQGNVILRVNLDMRNGYFSVAER
jgi:hypothetical protein